MRTRLFVLIVAMMSLLAPVTNVRAAEEGEPVIVDGRLKGYIDQKGANVEVQLDPSGTAVIWILTGLLGAVAVGFMFMNPRRTHLD
ncbi:MAG TPA: hypothetical protein VL282_18560 [Tepidisphaeraceae bacterium]|nr:hypothetical protein [Tepidisphaeraceae bacterium]